jgi:Ca2+-binding RTX toxin-like protein
VLAGSGAEHLYGGEGWDILSLLEARGDLVLDLSQPSASSGIARGDVIAGFEAFLMGAGDDTLRGTAATEYFYGGAGNDVAFSNGGNDRFYGGEGNDRFYPGEMKEFFIGGAGYDTVDFSFVSEGFVLDLRSRVAGTAFALRDGYREVEAFVGSRFGDTLRGSLGADVFFGQNGNDVLFGRGGGDTLWGGNGDDTLFGTDWDEVLDGGANFDLLDYSVATTAVQIDLGNPASNRGAAAGDRLTGFEAFAGSDFDDTLIGAAAVDWLYGGDGDDALFGGAENDVLTGGDGADTLNGGAGRDMLWGGLGADVFEGHTGFDTVGFAPFGARGVTADLATPANNRGGAARDVFDAIEGLIGTRYSDILNGDGGHNALTGYRDAREMTAFMAMKAMTRCRARTAMTRCSVGPVQMRLTAGRVLTRSITRVRLRRWLIWSRQQTTEMPLRVTGLFLSRRCRVPAAVTGFMAMRGPTSFRGMPETMRLSGGAATTRCLAGLTVISSTVAQVWISFTVAPDRTGLCLAGVMARMLFLTFREGRATCCSCGAVWWAMPGMVRMSSSALAACRGGQRC